MMATSDTVRRFRLPVPGSRRFGRCRPGPRSPVPVPAVAFMNWPFAGFCEGPQDAGNGFPAILRPGVARVEFQREPMSRRVST